MAFHQGAGLMVVQFSSWWCSYIFPPLAFAVKGGNIMCLGLRRSSELHIERQE